METFNFFEKYALILKVVLLGVNLQQAELWSSMLR